MAEKKSFVTPDMTLVSNGDRFKLGSFEGTHVSAMAKLVAESVVGDSQWALQMSNTGGDGADEWQELITLNGIPDEYLINAGVANNFPMIFLALFCTTKGTEDEGTLELVIAVK